MDQTGSDWINVFKSLSRLFTEHHSDIGKSKTTKREKAQNSYVFRFGKVPFLSALQFYEPL
jgi:hypothetical protein